MKKKSPHLRIYLVSLAKMLSNLRKSQVQKVKKKVKRKSLNYMKLGLLVVDLVIFEVVIGVEGVESVEVY